MSHLPTLGWGTLRRKTPLRTCPRWPRPLLVSAADASPILPSLAVPAPVSAADTSRGLRIDPAFCADQQMPVLRPQPKPPAPLRCRAYLRGGSPRCAPTSKSTAPGPSDLTPVRLWGHAPRPSPRRAPRPQPLRGPQPLWTLVGMSRSSHRHKIQHRLYAVLFPAEDVPGVWVAHCLELDIMATGSNAPDALDMLAEGIQIAAAENVKDGRPPLCFRSSNPVAAPLP